MLGKAIMGAFLFFLIVEEMLVGMEKDVFDQILNGRLWNVECLGDNYPLTNQECLPENSPITFEEYRSYYPLTNEKCLVDKHQITFEESYTIFMSNFVNLEERLVEKEVLDDETIFNDFNGKTCKEYFDFISSYDAKIPLIKTCIK